VTKRIVDSGLSEIVCASFLIGGWIDGAPNGSVLVMTGSLSERKRGSPYDRLAEMPVPIQYTADKAFASMAMGLASSTSGHSNLPIRSKTLADSLRNEKRRV
jgi:hypothetical protein